MPVKRGVVVLRLHVDGSCAATTAALVASNVIQAPAQILTNFCVPMGLYNHTLPLWLKL